MHREKIFERVAKQAVKTRAIKIRSLRSVRKKLRTPRRRRGISKAFAVRSGRRWTIRSAPRGGIVFARRLTDAQLRAWARSHKYKTKSA